MRRLLDHMQGRIVVVQAGGIGYRGILKEVSEEQVCLQGLTGWREIPMEKIARIRLAEGES
jgi:hypothetical protein